MEGVRQVEAVVAQGTPARPISRIGLVAGPIVALVIYLLLPIRASVAPAPDVSPQRALIPRAPAASFAFMMPVGTPPNAIVVGTGLVTIPQMCKVGVALNLASVILVTAIAYFIILPLIAMR